MHETPVGYMLIRGQYMHNKTEIEWQDRVRPSSPWLDRRLKLDPQQTWRLLENEGQKEVDDWSSVGFVGGAFAAARSPAVRQAGKLSLVRLAGGAAMGDLLGVVGYMVRESLISRMAVGA